MYSSIKDIKVGDKVHVVGLNHKGTVIDIKDGKAFSINDKNVVCEFSDRDKFTILKKISYVAKVIIDFILFLSKRPKIKY